jgi:hypothetical protein
VPTHQLTQEALKKMRNSLLIRRNTMDALLKLICRTGKAISNARARKPLGDSSEHAQRRVASEQRLDHERARVQLWLPEA